MIMSKIRKPKLMRDVFSKNLRCPHCGKDIDLGGLEKETEKYVPPTKPKVTYV